MAVVLLLLLLPAVSVQGQGVRKKKAVTVDTIPFKGRWAFRTNAADWVLTLPNVSVEFDLGSHINSKQSVGIGVKYNGNTRHKYLPSCVFNITDVRGEYRKYFRTEQSNIQRSDTLKVGLFTRLKEDVFTRYRKVPRYWRAYYGGIYAHGGNYSVKFGKKGYKGTYMGVGVSGGFTTPLYAYSNKCAIDFEMGASVGFIYTDNDVFTHDPESNCYPVIERKGGHLVPYPLITDLRVAFVYRFVSVRDKYKRGDTPRQAERKTARLKRKQAREAMNDSINAARKAAQEEEQKQLDLALRQQADSMGISLDSLKTLRNPEGLTKEARRALKEQQKAAKEAREAKEKADKKAAKEARRKEKEALEAAKEEKKEGKPKDGKQVQEGEAAGKEEES